MVSAAYAIQVRASDSPESIIDPCVRLLYVTYVWRSRGYSPEKNMKSSSGLIFHKDGFLLRVIGQFRKPWAAFEERLPVVRPEDGR
jgi:hypothetical protein